MYPGSYGPVPINMNTADLNGDMYFDLRGVSEPLECLHPTVRPGGGGGVGVVTHPSCGRSPRRRTTATTPR